MTKRCIPFFVFSATLFLAAALALHSNELQQKRAPMEQITLFIASDLHYLSPELTDHGVFFQELIQNADGKVMEYCEEITDAFIQQVTAQKPDALILSGDLTFNGAKLSHTTLAEKLLEIENAGIPVLALPGNHDLENPSAAAFRGNGYTLTDSISAQQFAEIYGGFGFDDAISRDSASLSYAVQLKPGLRVLMLDVNTADSPGALKAETLQWAERQLRDAARQGIHMLAVSHQNLLQHNSLFSYGFVMKNNAPLLALYEKYEVICNLSGHMHIQHIAQSENGLTEIAASALIVSPNQYGVLTLEGISAEYHTEPIPVPLLENADFPSYAHTFLWETAYRQAAADLSGDLPDAGAMARFFADINTAYVSGRMDTVIWEEAVFQNWKDRSALMYAYLQSLFNDGFQNHTETTFSIER
ncbi:MAG: metallophosphoesterase [Oscillospiraceae bacterium]|nr:metallophosphoesterase [Oscillospiraceae bacterium]